jgi:hypothetical protein
MWFSQQSAILLTALSLSIPSWSQATETSRTQGHAHSPVLGELIKVQANVLTVIAPDGKEQQLTIDQDTAQIGIFHQGVYVQAWVLPDGRTESIIAFRTNKHTVRELSMQP